MKNEEKIINKNKKNRINKYNISIIISYLMKRWFSIGCPLISFKNGSIATTPKANSGRDFNGGNEWSLAKNLLR